MTMIKMSGHVEFNGAAKKSRHAEFVSAFHGKSFDDLGDSETGSG